MEGYKLQLVRVGAFTLGLLCGGVVQSVVAEAPPTAALPENVPSVTYELPSTPYPTPPPEATPTPTPLPTPQPTATPPPACLYEGDFKWTWGYGQSSYKQAAFFQRSGNAKTSACLDAIIDDVNRQCFTKGTFIDGFSFGTNSPTHTAYYDDCFVATLAFKLFPDFTGSTAKVGKHSNGAVCTSLIKSDLKFCPREKGGYAGIMGCTSCGQGKVYLNENCKVVPEDKDKQICGGFTTNYQASSPVSLLWDDSADIEATTTAVQFPLNPYESNRWYQWKASAAAPLVVHDPLHRGIISSGSQLFGHWTFGGQHVAALGGGDATPMGGGWRDGYAALESIDQNRDGQVSGPELDALGLWFDANRDGVSDTGEVQTMQQAGVTKLFYRTDSRDEATGSIWANIGFEREVNGKVTVGRSVDWFGKSGNTPLDVSQKLGTRPSAEAKVEVSASPPAAAKSSGDRLSGIWDFNFEGTAGTRSAAGYLVLADRGQEDRAVFGYSVVNKPFKVASAANEAGKVTMYSLHGVRTTAKDGSETLQFTVDENGAQIFSEATLKVGLSKMEGTSTVTTAEGNRLSYRWKASRRLAQ